MIPALSNRATLTCLCIALQEVRPHSHMLKLSRTLKISLTQQLWIADRTLLCSLVSGCAPVWLFDIEWQPIDKRIGLVRPSDSRAGSA